MGLRRLAVAAALLAAAVMMQLQAAHAQPAATGKPPPGIPMWVIHDDDSTIYIIGTVHLLPDHAQWRDDRIETALAQSEDLWLEVAEIADQEALERALEPLFETYASWDGPPLSASLGEEDYARLKEELALVGATPDVIARTEVMQPWFALFALGRDDYFGGAHKSDNGIDVSLARMARARGLPVRGLETVEDQIVLSMGLTYEEQVAELRARIYMPRGTKAMMGRVADAAFGAWMRGDTNMVAALQVFMLGGMGRESYDALLRDRNENWADAVEEMLEGSGTHFIAVGAAHLVGPGSLPDILSERGITSERY